jgi:hypothetical protein
MDKIKLVLDKYISDKAHLCQILVKNDTRSFSVEDLCDILLTSSQPQERAISINNSQKIEKIETLTLFPSTDQAFVFGQMPSRYKNYSKVRYSSQCFVEKKSDTSDFDKIIKREKTISFPKVSDRNLIDRAFLLPSTPQAIAVVEKIINEVREGDFRWMGEAPIVYAMDYNQKLPYLNLSIDLRKESLEMRSEIEILNRKEEEILKVFLDTVFSFDSWISSMKAKMGRCISEKLGITPIVDSELTSIIERCYRSKGEFNLEIIKKIESSPFLYLLFNSKTIQTIRKHNQVLLDSFRKKVLIFPT